MVATTSRAGRATREPSGPRRTTDAALSASDLTAWPLDLPRTERARPVELAAIASITCAGRRAASSRRSARSASCRADDLQAMRLVADAWHGDLRRLADQGLIERTHASRSIDEPTRRRRPDARGQGAARRASRARDDGRAQQYHAGLVKPRELAHDAQLYRLYQAEAGRIEADGGRVDAGRPRLRIEARLPDVPEPAGPPGRRRRDERHRRRSRPPRGCPSSTATWSCRTSASSTRRRTAALEYRDVELVTEHYSRSQLAGKAQAGFALYRAAGAGRVRGGHARTGGTPFDPHHLERL